MKPEPKLAHLRGNIQKFHLSNVVHSVRKAIEGKVETSTARPLRDVDGWSDQAEVAFYEEGLCRRA